MRSQLSSIDEANPQNDDTVLIGPVALLPPVGVAAMQLRATMVRATGLSSIVDAIVAGATSTYTKRTSPLTLALIRALVLPTQAEAYARAALALASAQDDIDFGRIEAEVLILGEHSCPAVRARVSSLTIAHLNATCISRRRRRCNVIKTGDRRNVIQITECQDG